MGYLTDLQRQELAQRKIAKNRDAWILNAIDSIVFHAERAHDAQTALLVVNLRKQIEDVLEDNERLRTIVALLSDDGTQRVQITSDMGSLHVGWFGANPVRTRHPTAEDLARELEQDVVADLGLDPDEG